MQFFPLFLRLSGHPCLIVGGGEIAARKLRLLRKAEAQLTVVAPELCAELAGLAELGAITHLAERFAPEHMQGQALVIAATNDVEVNRRVASLGRSRNILVNVVDDLQASSALMPAIVDRSPVVIALSTSGTAPVLARRLRQRIETLLPSSFGRLAQLAGEMRRDVKRQLPDGRSRLRFWEQVFDGAVASRSLAGDASGARDLLNELLDTHAHKPEGRGEVYLVGAGPGDPDLLTLRALRCMQQADVVLYDRLVSAEILELVRRDAERIDVGKRRNRHTLPQDDINELLVKLAGEGKRVLRLKGGDPFLFGRGGEEIERLAATGVHFEVVPGITAATGCSAYAGIPLTHRDYAQACVFVTGHPSADGSLALDWQALAQPNQTVVVYMGLTALPTICAELLAHGCPADRAVALVENGTGVAQRVLVGTVSGLPAQVAAAEIQGPSLLIVGEVVRLREQLAWFGPDES